MISLSFIKKQMISVYLLIIYSIALLIQWHTLLNWDVSLLMHAADRLLSGGQYGIDFFDTDPPLILYLYSIPVIVAKVFSLSFVTTNYIYTFLVSVGMLALSRQLLSLFNDAYDNQSYLLLAIAAIFLFVPAMNFAQREHLMVMFILPYLLATALRLQQININRPLAILVGIFAGLGFAIKPQFFITFFIIELYYTYRERVSLKKIRLETITIILIVFIYLIAILAFNKTYLTLILPAISQYYYQGLKKIMWPLLVWTHPGLILSILPVCIYFLFFREKEKYPLESILALTVIGFAIVYLIQSTYWYYHVIPAFSFSLLLLFQLCYRYGKWALAYKQWSSFLFVFFAIVFTLYYPTSFIYHVNAQAVQSKHHGDIAELIEHLRPLPQDTSIYFFSGCLLPYPAIDYLKLKDLQLAQTYWFLPGIVLNSTSTVNYADAKNLLKNNSLLKHIFADVISKHPEVIVTDDRMNCNGIPFQFLNYFLNDTGFKKLFSHYYPIDRFETVTIYHQS